MATKKRSKRCFIGLQGLIKYRSESKGFESLTQSFLTKDKESVYNKSKINGMCILSYPKTRAGNLPFDQI